uniref:Lipase n=1 Tax=Photinus pyralis TaxID=7054 RepID=A0A1Y1LV43_PHOPY
MTAIRWRLLITACVIAIAAFLIVKSNKNNVCTTFEDYYSDRDKNPNCYYNPDHELEVPDIARRHGYPIEIYNVTTSDGYILTVFRIPHGRLSNKTSKKPLFLQHGITLNAGSFLIIGKKSLGFMLADAGYDVWLGNFRGSRYSNNHTHLDHRSESYWNFSFHENGVFDLDAQINLISTVTRRKIIYVGFSMGTTAAYIYFSTYPDQDKLKFFVGLAPVTYVEDVWVMKVLVRPWTLVAGFVQRLTHGRMYPRPFMPFYLYKLICFPYPFQIKMCQMIDMLIMGLNYEENDPETLPVSLLYNSDAVSVNTFWHFYQLVHANKFQYFDYGESGNLEKYNKSTPPLYDLSKVNVENHLFYAENDKLAPVKNVKRLFGDLPKTHIHKLYQVKDERFNHIDFVSGKNADRLVYRPVINLLNAIKEAENP